MSARAAVTVPEPPSVRPRWIRPVRAVLCAGGIVLLVVGGWHLTALDAAQLRNVATWLVAGLVLHDGVLVPAVTALTLGAGFVLRRLATRGIAGRRLRLPPGALAWIVGGLAVGGVLTLVVVPELHAQALGPANPTVVPGDYGLDLALAWAAIAVVVAAGMVGLSLRDRARRRRRAGRARP